MLLILVHFIDLFSNSLYKANRRPIFPLISSEINPHDGRIFSLMFSFKKRGLLVMCRYNSKLFIVVCSTQ
jgi:hypothetical protein